MPRRHHIPHSEYPYHVTARSHDGIWFHLPIDIVWKIMTDYLFFIHHAYGIKIHAFVLMNNHFHLLISTPKANLSAAMNYFMRETSKEINRLSNRTNQVYGGRYHRSLIKKQFYFNHVYKYIYRNPVTAGITKRCENYHYSTLHGLLGRSPLFIPLTEETLLFSDNELSRAMEWLNTPPTTQNYAVLRKALDRKELKFPKNAWNAQKHTLEMQVY